MPARSVGFQLPVNGVSDTARRQFPQPAGRANYAAGEDSDAPHFIQITLFYSM
jgi:hypothetical protein